MREREDVVDDWWMRHWVQHAALPIEMVKIDVGTAQLKLCLLHGCGGWLVLQM